MTISGIMYNVIAQKMLLDKKFMDELEKDPAAAIEKTLVDAEIPYTQQDVLDLAEEYRAWAPENHATVKKGYMKSNKQPMVL